MRSWLTNLNDAYHRRKVATSLGRVKLDNVLDIGCGSHPRNEFSAVEAYGVDFLESDDARVRRADLMIDPIPFEDKFFDLVTAYDFLEHIPRISCSCSGQRYPFLNVMSEIYRVLKPGGFFYSFTPTFPKKQVFQDPTHVNFLSEDSLRLYFAGEGWARKYGFSGSFEMVREGWKGSHRYSLMRAL